MIIETDYQLPSITPGYTFLLRNKRLSDADHEAPGQSVLFVHGATYGSTWTFDYPVEGRSWMDQMAADGFDAWCIDLVGYGGSDRPREMDQPAADNPPLVDTDHAVAEVNVAVEKILKDRGITRLSLIGYSWGTAICGKFAGVYPDKVEQLVLSGALWVEQGNSPRAIVANPGAYRTVDADSAMARWATGLSQPEIDAIVPAERVRAWCEAVVQCDPRANDTTPPLLRAPTGVMKDYMACAASGEPWYQPGLITAPTQIVVGELDRETTPEQCQKVFAQLTRAPEKRLTIVGGGTHTLLLEHQRHALINVVSAFLSSH